MRHHSTFLAAAILVAGAGDAMAASAQCFLRGQPYGPLYATEDPSSNNWVFWVQRLGGNCRVVSHFEQRNLRRLPQVYPSDYTASYNRPGHNQPPAYRPGYNQPGDEENWRGDPNRGAYLVSQWLAQQGRPYGQVRDTERVEPIYERTWRIFFVRWADGSRARVAVRYSRRQGGTYLAMLSYGGGAWGEPQPIGQ